MKFRRSLVRLGGSAMQRLVPAGFASAPTFDFGNPAFFGCHLALAH